LQVRSFAKLHLRRAKTDRIDASLIAACTPALEPQARTPDPRMDALVDALTSSSRSRRTSPA
jgi:transposase